MTIKSTSYYYFTKKNKESEGDFTAGFFINPNNYKGINTFFMIFRKQLSLLNL
jgi:hypothetical protein